MAYCSLILKPLQFFNVEAGYFTIKQLTMVYCSLHPQATPSFSTLKCSTLKNWEWPGDEARRTEIMLLWSPIQGGDSAVAEEPSQWSKVPCKQ